MRSDQQIFDELREKSKSVLSHPSIAICTVEDVKKIREELQKTPKTVTLLVKPHDYVTAEVEVVSDKNEANNIIKEANQDGERNTEYWFTQTILV